MPAQTVSAVHIACAKRAILCEILSSGKVSEAIYNALNPR